MIRVPAQEKKHQAKNDLVPELPPEFSQVFNKVGG